ncbi:MAG: aldehyde dehydrogenase family protein, partial [Planctomycetales bacterium]|nr:aldehyde dehydrogenase family protein [Planctomycetales bacterium]
MQLDESIIRNVVRQVLAEVGSIPALSAGVATHAATNGTGLSGSGLNGAGPSYFGRYGVFTCVQEAVAAAKEAFAALSHRTIEDRKRIIDHIRRISIEQAVELGTMEMEETQIGRLEHKIEKLRTLGEKTPGVEFLRSEAFSGDKGLAVIEHAPFGVIGAITPVTHSLPTITGNAVSMIAGGNVVVVNPHPSGKKVAAEGVRRFNQAIAADLGID